MEHEMSKSVNRVKAALQAAGVAPDVLEMPATTRTAAEAAAAVGCGIDQIAKSILFRGGRSGRLFLFIVAGGNRICPKKAEELAGEPLEKAGAEQIRAETGFAIGGVAPVGHLQPLRAFFDRRLDHFPVVWAAAGTPRHVFSIAPDVLCAIGNAERADFVQ
jgi:prolyl-tRNA editing enzyme YbaK/EbsC (Cys-tRNA(Pro) deacylase)